MSISPSEKIKVSIDGNIATIVIDNPGANTWDRESLPALRQVIETLNGEPTVYALVLTGAGQKFFSAGADLNQFASVMPMWRAPLGRPLAKRLRRLQTSEAFRLRQSMALRWGVGLRLRWPVIFALQRSRQR